METTSILSGRGLLKSVTGHPRDSSGKARKRVLQTCGLPHGICDEDCFYLHFLKLFFSDTESI